MRAELSTGQAALFGAGAFVTVVTAFAVAAVFAVGGPITDDEAANINQAAAGFGHTVKGAVHRLSSGVCRRLPGDLGMALHCAKPHAARPKPSLVAAHTHTRAAPHHARIAPARHPARRHAASVRHKP